jgi:mono/diheme cytochrome c family protein
MVKIAFSAALALALVAAARPMAAAQASAADGERIYDDYCATCHGDHLENNSAGLTFDLRRLRPDEHARFVNSVRNGKNRMPPWKGVLDDGQIEALWSYIQATAAH